MDDDSKWPIEPIGNSYSGLPLLLLKLVGKALSYTILLDVNALRCCPYEYLLAAAGESKLYSLLQLAGLSETVNTGRYSME